MCRLDIKTGTKKEAKEEMILFVTSTLLTCTVYTHEVRETTYYEKWQIKSMANCNVATCFVQTMRILSICCD